MIPEEPTPEETKKSKIPRKEFLQTTGLAALGVLFLPETSIPGIPLFTNPTAKIALQLYTVRNEISKNIPDTLRKIAAMGFEYVETAFWPENVSVKQAAQFIKDAGLSVSSAHISLPIGDNKTVMLETAEAYSCKKMIWHGWPEDKRYSTLDGTKELVSLYNEANHFAKSNGLEFGLHNHWWEFRNQVSGRYVYQVLLENVEPDIFFEIDTYWVKVAGQDPAKIVGLYGKRAPLLHIKDGPARWTDSLLTDHPEPMVAVGKGAQNFPAIVQAANGNTEWMIVEMDNTATDVFAAIQDSYTYLIKNGFATGRKKM
ncbi:MAG TPA: sugar phosphate isomerase/epimerase [Puia sp.]|nr:sugar phosphate isomerase/epimerase [Puia sp.]